MCILSAINVGKVNSDKELEEMCDLTVRSLDELIDYQDYPVKAAEVLITKARRSLGVGFIGLAHYLAKLGFNYDSQESFMGCCPFTFRIFPVFPTQSIQQTCYREGSL